MHRRQLVRRKERIGGGLRVAPHSRSTLGAPARAPRAPGDRPARHPSRGVSSAAEVHDSMPQHSSQAHWSLRTALGQPQNESHRAGEALPIRRLVRQRTATI